MPSSDLNSDEVVASLLNLYAPSSGQQARHADRLKSLQPPPDMYCDKAFLLRIQYTRPTDADGISAQPQYAICDQQRSLDGFLRSKGNNPPWSTLVVQIPPLALDETTYRWAKRTGDWELSICLDREPTGSQ